MRTKKDTQRSLAMVSGHGHASPTAWAGLIAVLHDLVDRLPDDETLPAPAPVSDTRRKDVARAVRDAIDQSYTFEGDLDPDVDRRVTDAVLAVLPAPPVVDEAGIAKVLAEFDSVPWANMRRETKDIYRSMAAAVAAHLNRARR